LNHWTTLAATAVIAILATGPSSRRTAVPSPTVTATAKAARTLSPPPIIAADATARTFGRNEIRCLARAVWQEAQGEPVRGQIAVAEVIIHRAADDRWKDDLCGVIRERSQFSFVKDGVIPEVEDAEDAQAMMDLVRGVIAGRLESGLSSTLFFHATYVSPKWKLRRIARVGHHVFYGDLKTART
jgi:N-acetylmuramoyl-L-alanine amidase